jgi:hypothetical protein
MPHARFRFLNVILNLFYVRLTFILKDKGDHSWIDRLTSDIWMTDGGCGLAVQGKNPRPRTIQNPKSKIQNRITHRRLQEKFILCLGLVS